MRKPRLSKRQVNRLAGLLPMLYSVPELCEVVGVHRSTVYECYIPNGCPHSTTEAGHYRINGVEFAAWARSTLQDSEIELADGEAFCLRCRMPVAMRPPITRRVVKSAVLVMGKCPQCTSDVARFESGEEGPPEEAPPSSSLPKTGTSPHRD